MFAITFCISPIPYSLTFNIIYSNLSKSLIVALVDNLILISLISFLVNSSIWSIIPLNYYTFVFVNILSIYSMYYFNYVVADFCCYRLNESYENCCFFTVDEDSYYNFYYKLRIFICDSYKCYFNKFIYLFVCVVFVSYYFYLIYCA